MDMAYLDLWATIVAILVTSLIWRIYRVRCHRFDRYNALHKKYARLVNDLDRMTCASLIARLIAANLSG